jgi:hypothetical protein
MKSNRFAVLAVLWLFFSLAAFTASAATTTTFACFEDTLGPHSDNDCNDSIAATGATLHQIGGIFINLTPAIALSNSGDPFWDNASFDGIHDNFGDCALGLGTGVCATPFAATNLQYLATTSGSRVNAVWFTGALTLTSLGGITADTDVMGVCGEATEGTGCDTPITWLTGTSVTVDYPVEELVAKVNGSILSYSNPTYGQISTFGFITGADCPEPNAAWLAGVGLALVLTARARHYRKPRRISR